MNANGAFDEEATRAKIPSDIARDKAEEVITKCKDLSEHISNFYNS